jgi:hypothetical protein
VMQVVGVRSEELVVTVHVLAREGGEGCVFSVSPATLAGRIASAPMVGQGATLFIALGRRVERDALHGGAYRKCGLQMAGECLARALKVGLLC